MSLAGRVERIWYGPSQGDAALAAALNLGTWIYRLGLGARQSLYRAGIRKAKRLPLPVVSVGNLVVGGTGKTPTVSWIVRFLIERGRRPAVISRGYGGVSRGPEPVPASGDAEASRQFGDEPVMLASLHPGVPVVIGRDRWEAGAEAYRMHDADILVADDAFQHRSLARDLDLVVVDAGRLFGNGRLFPRGPLREFTPALQRAGVVLLNRIPSAGETLAQRREDLQRLAPQADIVEGDIVPSGWRRFDSRTTGAGPPPGKVHAFCGLANPEVFFGTLEGMSIEVTGRESFPDHHPYLEKELEELASSAALAGAAAVVTTAKDAVRIGRWPADIPLYVLDVKLVILDGEERLARRLSAVAGRPWA